MGWMATDSSIQRENQGVSQSGYKYRDTCDDWMIGSAQNIWRKELFVEEAEKCFEEVKGLALSTSRMNGFKEEVCEWTKMTLLDNEGIPRFRK